MSSHNHGPNTQELIESAIEEGKKLVAVGDAEIKLLLSIPQILKPIIKQICFDHKLPIKDIIPVGSSQRKTFLPGSRDIDIFVRFDTDQRSILEGFAQEIIPQIAKQLNTTYIIKRTKIQFRIPPY